jgi:hypothetical protein
MAVPILVPRRHTLNRTLAEFFRMFGRTTPFAQKRFGKGNMEHIGILFFKLSLCHRHFWCGRSLVALLWGGAYKRGCQRF